MIKPVKIITNNVQKELNVIALRNATSTSQLYIEVNSIKTFVKKADTDFVEIFGNDFERYTNETALEDPTLEFEQEYDITILSKYKSYPFENMLCEIEFQENESLAYFLIKKGSKLHYYDSLYEDFLQYIIEKKLRSNILIYLFDVDYKSTIREFVNVIQKIKKLTFKEDKKFLVAEGLNAIESINAEISMLIEDGKEIGVEDSEGRVDYSNRGFMLSCVEGEQLFEFIKPQQGKNGRNCKGEIIEVETVNLNTKPTFTVENGIEVEDSYENIKYFSNKSGYLVKTGNKYDISNNIDINEISFKTTGTINSNLDSEISINVIKNNPLEDAIEEGMHVKVQTLNVKGSIGPNTQIEARDISIDGQTHNESFIQCINASLGQHRGKIIARKVEVKTLEGGEIIADVVSVKNALRGSIKAKTIDIESLGSHVKLEASQTIKIDLIKGEENKFIVDTSLKSPFYQDNDKRADKAYLEKLQEELKPLHKTLKELTEKLTNNLQACQKIKATIIKSKKEDLEIAPTLIKNFKLCQVMKVRYKKLKEEFEYQKTQIVALKKKLSSHTVSPFDVKITINNPRRSYNSIIYKLNNPQREIELKIDENMTKKVFKLIEDEEGILKIVNSAS